jgi:hypothetical protein
MRTKYAIGNGILWAAAILAAALLHGPSVLCSLILPALAICSFTILEPRAIHGAGQP